MSSSSEELHNAALAYHRLPRPGKLEIQAIKPLANQRDLALARYSTVLSSLRLKAVSGILGEADLEAINRLLRDAR